jgi:hypothetical protein
MGLAPKARSLASLEGLLCASCRAELPKFRSESLAERDIELRRRAYLSNRYHLDMERQAGHDFE